MMPNILCLKNLIDEDGKTLNLYMESTVYNANIYSLKLHKVALKIADLLNGDHQFHSANGLSQKSNMKKCNGSHM